MTRIACGLAIVPLIAFIFSPSGGSSQDLATGSQTGSAQAQTSTTALNPSVAELHRAMTRGNPLWAISLDSLQATRTRPVFSPSRRAPARTAIPSASMPAANRPLLALVGTIAAGSDGIALLFEETTKSMVRLKVGEGYGGWILRAVDRREATLENDRETAILVLSTQAGQ